MGVRPRLSIVTLVCCLFLCPCLVASGEEARPALGPSTLVLIAEGRMLEKGLWKFSIEPGPASRYGIVFYSEPSHKPIGIVVDKTFQDSKDGIAWLEKTQAGASEIPLEAVDLPDKSAEIRLLPFSEKDEAFSIWVLSDWNDERRELRRVTRSTAYGDKIHRGYLIDLNGRTFTSMPPELALRLAGHPERWDELILDPL